MIFSAGQGVCDFCHDLLLIKVESFLVKHHNYLSALAHSSLSCPCCAILLQSFDGRAYNIWRTLETAPTDSAYFAEDVGPLTPVTFAQQKFDDDDFSELTLELYPQHGAEHLVPYSSLLLFCTAESELLADPNMDSN